MSDLRPAQRQTGLQRESGLPGGCNLSPTAANASPLQRAFNESLADDVGERIATCDSMHESEGIAQVALSRGVGPDNHRQRPDT